MGDQQIRYSADFVVYGLSRYVKMLQGYIGVYIPLVNTAICGAQKTEFLNRSVRLGAHEYAQGVERNSG